MNRHVHLLTRASTATSPTIAVSVEAIMARLQDVVTAAESAL